MTFDPNDPRLTAFATGELDPSELESLENLLKESDEARQAVEEIRATVGWLTRGLHHEQDTHSPQPPLNHQPVAVDSPQPPRATRSWWSRNAFKLGSLAALFLLAVGLTLVAVAPRGEPDPRPSLVAAVAVAPRGEPDPRPSLVAASKARRVAGEIAAKAALRAEDTLGSLDVLPAPSVAMTPAPETDGAKAVVRYGRVTDTIFARQPARRRSVVQGSAGIELAFTPPGGNRETTLALAEPATEREYFKLNVQEQAPALVAGDENRQVIQANQGQGQGMGGGAGMMNSRDLSQNAQQVSGPHLAKPLGPAQAPQGSALARRQSEVPIPAGASAAAAATAKTRSRASVSSLRAAAPSTAGASRARLAEGRSAPAAKQVAKLQPESQLAREAEKVPESRAKHKLADVPQQTGTPTDNPFLSVREAPKSTFLIDVDTASYASISRALGQNTLPPRDVIRAEELLNEFPHHDVAPPRFGLDPFAIHVEIAGCPWDERHRLARIGITARAIDQANRPACNFVLLVDVSPSMREPNRLPLVQWSLNRLVDQLGERDRLAIVAFGQTPGIVLDSTSGLAKAKIRAMLDDLRVASPDATRSGLALAYEIAGQSFLERGTNRVILVTDASSTIGAMQQDDLIGLVAAKAASGVSLSVVGVGARTVDDSTIATLADKGRGHHAHVGTPLEAYRVLVEEMGSKLATIATSAQTSIEFSSDRVSAYRLIGYDGANAPPEGLIDDTRDAGAIVEGHHITALYEIVPAAALNLAQRLNEELQEGRVERPATLTVRVSYRKPDEGRNRLIEQIAVDRETSFDRASDDFKLAAAVAGFGALLRESPFAGRFSYDAAREIIEPFLAGGSDPSGYYREFAELIGKAKALSSGRQ